MNTDIDSIRVLDREDPLAAVRGEFDLPAGTVYLVGNSLGPLPVRTRQRMQEVVERQWGRELVAGWNTHDWFHLPERAGAAIARLVGAGADEVIVADSTSVNLYKLMLGAVSLQAGRHRLLVDQDDFPTNLYVARSVQQQVPGLVLESVDAADLASRLDDRTALVSLNHVNYRTGELRDMARITGQVQAVGGLMLWDLCHSAGALPVALNDCNADLAVGCGYKYLNGGPGAPAFLHVAERHQARMPAVISGWMGHASPFSFNAEYLPHPGIRRQLSGTPAVLGLSALLASLEVFDGLDMAAVRAKSVALTDLFTTLVEPLLEPHGLTLVSPSDADHRGSQVSLSHPQGYALVKAMAARGIMGDFRAPSILRFGFPALYTRFEDAWLAARALANVLETGEWQRPEYAVGAVVT